ncbi:fungal specific transcription factor domain-containing protein [Colletotrichum salicis]|uniref:Fungal specific transcription factor domain-containing protein n=1 Tax=Colletotrichum salicis TaxID=1209931 RepID=A0A135TEE2_9PEZI|nr:fungal specific transcription factor domain-containing protein [Colletotrichum salicis]
MDSPESSSSVGGGDGPQAGSPGSQKSGIPSAPKTRTTRGKYISKACDTDSQAIQSLRDQVASLQGGLDQLRRHQSQQPSENHSSPLHSEAAPIVIQDLQVPLRNPDDPVVDPELQPGPIVVNIESSTSQDEPQPSASYTFNISLARTHLRARGIGTADHESGGMPGSVNPTRPPSPSIQTAFGLDVGSIDPLWLINEEEAVRLCNVYEEEIGIQYPFLDIEWLIERVRSLYHAMNSGSRLGFAFAAIPGPTIIDPQDLSLVKMVLSTALTVEAGGSSQLGRSLFLDVRKSSHDKLWESASIKSTMLYILLAVYSFMTGDDLQAWRLVGIVARWCLEMGLHQSATISKTFKDAGKRKRAMRLFWCVYTLDRRWGFGAGLPFVMHNFDVDQQLPEPDQDVSYLRAMVEYSRIGDKVWATSYNSARATGAIRDDEISYLLYRIDQWYEDLPEDLRLSSNEHTASPNTNSTTSRGLQRLQVLLHLRANQMKILLLQPFLHSTSSLKSNKSKVQSLVNLAKDTIQMLDALNKSTDIYQNQQMCFNHFLVSALGVIFLVVALSPMEHGASVRDEFHTALDLIRGLSARSYVSSRLWRRISDLRLAWRKLGLNAPQSREARGPSTQQGHALVTPPTSSGGMDIPPGSVPTAVDDGLRGPELDTWPAGSVEPFTEAQMAQELNDFFNSIDGGGDFGIPLPVLGTDGDGLDPERGPEDSFLVDDVNASMDVSHLFVDML